MNFESVNPSSEAKKKDDEGMVKLDEKEIKKLIAKLNDPRIDANSNQEYFIISLNDRRRFVPKVNKVPQVVEKGKSKLIKIEDFLNQILTESQAE